MDFEQQLQLGMDHLARIDDVMKDLIKRFGVPTYRPHTNYYQALVGNVISQQLSVKAAAAISGRFIDLYGHYPTPAEIVATDTEALRRVGLSRQKISYVNDIAQRVIDGVISFESIDTLNNQQVIDEFIRIKGVGTWTVHMFLLFAVGRLDVLAVGDLGIRNAISRLYNFDHVVKDVEIIELSDRLGWHPYESLVCWYAWQSLDNSPA